MLYDFSCSDLLTSDRAQTTDQGNGSKPSLMNLWVCWSCSLGEGLQAHRQLKGNCITKNVISKRHMSIGDNSQKLHHRAC